MHAFGFPLLVAVCLTPAVLATWFDPKSRRRRKRERREGLTKVDYQNRVERRSRLSKSDRGVWRNSPVVDANWHQKQDEDAPI